MVIVLVIMGIITLMIMRLTGIQLQKLQRKTEKEALLTAYHNRYSKNLTSAFFAGEKYQTMTIIFATGTSSIAIAYFTGQDEPFFTDSIQGDFQIEQIILNPNEPGQNIQSTGTLTLTLQPYEIPCKLGENDFSEIILLISMRQQKNYCFNISHKSCRMREVKCNASRDPEFIADFTE
ncbi:MAG: hypothetical protein LBG59_02795 [Candidatus Peribacteria bacterium]|nr:hypothetical protein [Candidatus Peribacteria bacterium]